MAGVITHDVADVDMLPPAPARQSGFAALTQAVAAGLSAGLLLLVLGVAILVIAVPALVGGMPLTILTGSMSPSMPPGTLVVVKPTPVDEIQVGDVLTFQLESGKPALVTHRVVARVTDTGSDAIRFVTQGDANARPDESEVLPVQVKGTVWFAVPWLGWVNQFMGGARGWLVPVIAAALFSYAVWMIFAGLLGSRRRRSSPPDGEGETEPAHPSGARAGAAPGWP